MRQLFEQVGFMLKSAKSFDEGDTAEGKRLAGIMRVLLHDKPPNSTSVLEQLFVKNDMGFYNTARNFPREGMDFIPTLLWISMGPDGGEPQPLLDRFPSSEPPKKVPFDTWWTQPVIRVPDGGEFTREYLVTKVANQDGGAHVDPKPDKRYVDLSKHNALHWTFIVDGKEMIYENVALACLRQIAHELLMSLEDKFPDLFHQRTPMPPRFDQESGAMINEAHVTISKMP